jgi:hypothetical protein
MTKRFFCVEILVAAVLWLSACESTSVRTVSPSAPSTPTTPPTTTGAVIQSISPSGVSTGSGDFTLTVIGKNFVHGTARETNSIVTWSVNGTDTSLATTFVNSGQLTATVPAGLLTAPTTANVLILNWHFADDVPSERSNTVTFRVN